MKIAASRPEPIPVYAEMSSINPVLLFPGALAARGEAIGKAFVGALTMGAGQFCTNPGLILAVDNDGLNGFVEGAKAALASAPAATMLTPGIHKAYCEGVSRLKSHSQVKMLGEGTVGERFQGQAALFSTTSEDFLKHPELQEEVFGSSSLIVRCKDEDELGKVLDKLEGQLTIALHMEASDHDAARRFMPILEEKAGRVLVNGFGTGVEVGHAMVHGGPYPATSDGRTTSVGSLAITRFLRPVSYQDVPGDLLPPALSDENPFGIQRKMDGK
jgi:NADP-dependent aldehyde dehydrogenase